MVAFRSLGALALFAWSLIQPYFYLNIYIYEIPKAAFSNVGFYDVFTEGKHHSISIT